MNRKNAEKTVKWLQKSKWICEEKISDNATLNVMLVFKGDPDESIEQFAERKLEEIETDSRVPDFILKLRE